MGKPTVVDNELSVPDLEPTIETRSFLLSLKAMTDGDRIRDQARQALRLDLGARLHDVREKLGGDLTFERDNGCFRGDVDAIEVTSVHAHATYVRVYVQVTARARLTMPSDPRDAGDPDGRGRSSRRVIFAEETGDAGPRTPSVPMKRWLWLGTASVAHPSEGGGSEPEPSLHGDGRSTRPGVAGFLRRSPSGWNGRGRRGRRRGGGRARHREPRARRDGDVDAQVRRVRVDAGDLDRVDVAAEAAAVAPNVRPSPSFSRTSRRRSPRSRRSACARLVADAVAVGHRLERQEEAPRLDRRLEVGDRELVVDDRRVARPGTDRRRGRCRCRACGPDRAMCSLSTSCPCDS